MSTFDRSVIRKFLQLKLSGKYFDGVFIFRRVMSVTYPKNVSPIYTKYTLPNEEPKTVFPSSFNRKELEKSIQIDCETFCGIACSRPIRDEPHNIYGKEIAFETSTFRNFDITGLTFSFERVKPVTPIEGDLICIFLPRKACERSYGDNRNYERPIADSWFIVSDQYLRAYTAIMYDVHDALTSLIPKTTSRDQKEEKLKEKLFSGNRLMTNTWLKTKLAYEHNGSVFPRDASIEAYWHLRCDNASKYWVDVLATLVLISRYGELPCSSNVPNTKDGGFQRKSWNLPESFERNLFKLCKCEYPEIPQYNNCEDKEGLNIPCEIIHSTFVSTLELVVEVNAVRNCMTIRTQTNTPAPKKRALDIALEIDWNDDSNDYLYNI
jgi:hypothetical protein